MLTTLLLSCRNRQFAVWETSTLLPIFYFALSINDGWQFAYPYDGNNVVSPACQSSYGGVSRLKTLQCFVIEPCFLGSYLLVVSPFWISVSVSGSARQKANVCVHIICLSCFIAQTRETQSELMTKDLQALKCCMQVQTLISSFICVFLISYFWFSLWVTDNWRLRCWSRTWRNGLTLVAEKIWTRHRQTDTFSVLFK